MIAWFWNSVFVKSKINVAALFASCRAEDVMHSSLVRRCSGENLADHKFIYLASEEFASLIEYFSLDAHRIWKMEDFL